MKIVHVSSSDSGGAGIAALRLNRALNGIGVDSKLLCVHKFSGDSNVVKYDIPFIDKVLQHSHIPFKQNRYLNDAESYKNEYETVSFPNAIYDISKSPIIQEADIINLHWVGNILNYKKFFKNVKKPIVWTLHDMNPFLGLAHYMGDYKRVVSTRELEHNLQNVKRNAISIHGNIHIVNLCDWMKGYSQASEIFKNCDHSVIANSVNTDVFTLRDKHVCREALGLPKKEKIILFCCQDLSNNRKGFDLLLNAIPNIGQDCMFAIIGKSDKVKFPDGIRYKAFGTLKDELLMSMIYSAADGFVLSSREDNLPNTMLESLCCGTPVISFSNGGMRDIIVDGTSGILVETQSSEALAEGIIRFLHIMDTFNRKSISMTARNKFAPDMQAGQYLELYKRILMDKK